MTPEIVVNTALFKVYRTFKEIIPYIHMEDGRWLEHASFKNDLMGMTSVFLLAADVHAGKFVPVKVIDNPPGGNNSLPFEPKVLSYDSRRNTA